MKSFYGSKNCLEYFCDICCPLLDQKLKKTIKMKAIKVFAAAFAASALVAACTSKPAADIADPTTVKNVEDLLPTASQIDSASYLIGINFGYFITSNNFGDDLNFTQIRKGMMDFLNAKGEPGEEGFNDQFKVNPDLMNQIFNEFLTKRSEYTAELNRREGVKFLEQNKKKDGVVETESGLQYKIVATGNGKHPSANDTVMVNYRGTLINGTEFDSNPEGEPIAMALDRVIPGWTEGIQLVDEGGKIELYIPSELAYGSRGNRAIEPNSTLIFEVELVEIVAPETPAE